MLNIYKNQKDLGQDLKQIRIINETTLQQLSKKTGLSVAFLSQMELGTRTIKPIDFYKILYAHNISFVKYLSELTNKLPARIAFKENERILLFHDDKKSAYQFELISYASNETVELTLNAKSICKDLLQIHSIIHLFVFKGSIIIYVNKNEYNLKQGDALLIDNNASIEFRNDSEEEVKVILNTESPAI